MTGLEAALRVRIASWMLGDGWPPPPVVGEIGEYAIAVEVPVRDDPSDLSITDLIGQAIPDGPPFVSGPPDDVHRIWPTRLRGVGWEARWRARRPMSGAVHIRGALAADQMYGSPIPVRGRILRVRIESVLMRADAERGRHAAVPGTRRYRDVQECPQWFGGPSEAIPEDGGVRHEWAAIVDLDLADAPPPEPRPAICPSSVAVDGDVAWVTDQELPVVARLDLVGGRCEEFVLPGSVTGREDYEIPSVWAAAGTCWAFRSDGVFRIADGAVACVTTAPVDSVVPRDDTALVALRAEGNTVRLHLITAGDIELGAPVRVGDAPRWGVATETGFLLLTCNGEMEPDNRTHRLVRIDEAGEVTVGPVLHEVGPNPDGFGGRPPRIATGRMLGRPVALDVRADLTVERSSLVPPIGWDVHTVDGDVFLVCHPSDGTGDDGWWPLDGPCPYRSEEQFWLLARLDGDTLAPVAVAPIHTTQVSVARHGDEHLVATGTGLFRWRGTGFSELDEIPLAELLDDRS